MKAAILKLALFLVLAGGIWLSPIYTPKLLIAVSSDRSAQSQLYTSKNAIFSEESSELLPLSAGKNELSFDLGNASSPARWDPSQTTINLNISNIAITVAGFRISDSAVSVKPANQIASITNSGETYALTTTTDANDPQTTVTFDDTRIFRLRLLITLLTAFAASFIIYNHQTIASKLGSTLHRINNTQLSLRQNVALQSFSSKEFFILFLTAAVLNSYFITTLSLSIDDEMGALRTDPEVWVSQGRWAVYLIEKFLIQLPAIPFLPYLILDIALTLSYMMIIRAHGATPSWKSYLTFPIFCSYPTWWLISEFSSNVPAVALGLLLSVFSACLSAGSINGLIPSRSKFKHLLICLMLATAIASYQSLILLYLSIGLGMMLIGLIRADDKQTFHLIKNGVRFLAYAVGAMLTYFVINKVFQNVTGAYSTYLNNFINIAGILQNPIFATKEIIIEAGRIYSGSEARFGATIGLAPVIVITATLALLKFTPIQNKLYALFIWTLVLATPFLLHFLAGAGGVPMRTMIPLAYVTWLMAFLLLTTTGVAAATVFMPIIAVYLVQLLNVNSQYIASATLAQKHDELLAADIYRRIGEIDRDFDSTKPVNVDFFGHKRFETIYAKAWTSTMQASFFDWDNGNILRMLNYMKVLGYPNLHAVDENLRKNLTPTFMDMPVWPAQGAVQKHGDIYLIRLSKDADPAHH